MCQVKEPIIAERRSIGSRKLLKYPEPVTRRVYHHQSKSVSGLESVPLLTKFSKRNIDKAPLHTQNHLNAFATQSVRNVEQSHFREAPFARSQFHTERVPHAHLLNKRPPTPNLADRNWERNNMSRSVGLLPRVQRTSSRMRRTIEKPRPNPRRPPVLTTPMQRSMTGLERRKLAKPPMRRALDRKFSEIPHSTKWAHRTMDWGQSHGANETDPNNILSFKKDSSYEQETPAKSWNRPATGEISRLRTVQSNLSQARPAQHLQVPISYSQVRQPRTSIEENQMPPSFSQVHANPSQKDLLNTSQTIAASVYMNPEPRSFSEEDMEHRLTLLFRKMLVFSSKIDTLKDKIVVNNPSFSSYRLFVRFSGERRTHMDLLGLTDFFRAFNFDFGTIFVEKMMIFLSNYQLDGPSSFAEGTGDEDAFDGGFVPPRAYESRWNNNDINGRLSISYGEFKDLLVTEERNHIDWAVNDKHPKDINILNTEYHLIRQILLLLHRKLTDIGHIVRTLRPYPTEDIFRFLTKFNSPSHVKIQSNSFDPDNPTSPLESGSTVRLQTSGAKQFTPDAFGNIVEGGTKQATGRSILWCIPAMIFPPRL